MIPNERRNQTSAPVVVAKDNIKWKNKTLSFRKQKEKKNSTYLKRLTHATEG